MFKRINSSRLWLTLVFVLAVAFIAGFGIVLRQTARAQSNEEAAVRDVLLKSALSFEKNDIAMATRVWANDESMTVFEQGHANYGWADYRDNHLVPEMKEIKNTKYTLSDIRIHMAGATAWATFKYNIWGDVTESGASRHVDGQGLGTAVLEKRADGWRIVHWHSSAPRRAPANPAKKD